MEVEKYEKWLPKTVFLFTFSQAITNCLFQKTRNNKAETPDFLTLIACV
ncbi:hypothetical protein Niako_1350 [Niastella koreensis GR20-10]|uniref:Uncharacterized protein n=1 Tax=Niastella koreensis (strain DSM 17620 / KACC 11465 / NBRC 106392 / GR20-10) TaxID=700598 RepID=G8TN36_NIAKG|nr:hypothetical protein Niako_1350 [Niastella koreensis GR20-10]